MPHDIASVLEDILEAAQFIAEDTQESTFEEYLQNRRMRQLVERNFLIIGEALNRLRRQVPESAAQIQALQQIIGFRNVLVHGCDLIDPAIVWETIDDHLPALVTDVKALLMAINENRTA